MSTKKYAIIRGDEDGNPIRWLTEEELTEVLEDPVAWGGIERWVESYEDPNFWDDDVAMLIKFEVLTPRPITRAWTL